MDYRHSVAWWEEAVFYQIYPRSFADASGDGVGDLRGITSKLDYLEVLGIDALWISPFFPSPMRDFGYDVSDYCDIDPVFGTLHDFDELVDEAHRRNIKVIIDWVPNHTSSDHPWFTESRSSRENPRRSWYVWRSLDEKGRLPNNWIRAWSDQPAWTRDDLTGEYYLHCFLESQPDLNWDEPLVRQAMHNVLRFWLDRGVDGFRMDVVHLIGKELSRNDDPELAALTHVILNDVPIVHDYLREIRSVLDGYADRVSVGEVALFDPHQVATYYGQGDELHLSFNFKSLMTPWRASAWADLIRETEETHAAVSAWPTWVLSNHDNPRIATRLGAIEERVRSALVLLLSLRGTPFLYAGEELGLPDAEIPSERVVDPGGRDGCRSPIPWQQAPPFGWTDNPWLPFGTSAAERSVEAQRNDVHSTWHFCRMLLQLRRSEPALLRGTVVGLEVRGDVMVFERHEGTSRLAVAVNFADSHAEIPWSTETIAEWLLPAMPPAHLSSNGAVIVRLR